LKMLDGCVDRCDDRSVHFCRHSSLPLASHESVFHDSQKRKPQVLAKPSVPTRQDASQYDWR
jgi:hypothetical protein